MKPLGQKVGYIRVSSVDQNPARQLEGLNLDRVFLDKFTGKTLERPQLQEMVKYVREGDEVYVHSMDRLARTLMDLRNIVKTLTEKKVIVHFRKENITFTGNDDPISILLLSMMGAVAEFELSFIRERQQEGIRIAKEKGMPIGRPKAISKKQLEEIIDMIKSGKKNSLICKELGLARSTLYKHIKLYSNS